MNLGVYYIRIGKALNYQAQTGEYYLFPELNGKPNKPTVYDVCDTYSSVSGTADFESKIIIRYRPKVIGSGKVDINGKFKVAIPKVKAGTTFSVTATDAQGISSLATIVKVKQKND